MKTTGEWMSETMQPIIDRIAGGPISVEEEREARERIERMTGPSFRTAFQNVFHTCKAADRLPPGCDGCRVDLSGTLICCVNQGEEE